MLKKELTIDDFTIITPMSYIRWEEVKEIMGKRRYKKFVEWIRGSTCAIEGVYPGDLESYLNQINRGVKKPLCYD